MKDFFSFFGHSTEPEKLKEILRTRYNLGYILKTMDDLFCKEKQAVNQGEDEEHNKEIFPGLEELYELASRYTYEAFSSVFYDHNKESEGSDERYGSVTDKKFFHTNLSNPLDIRLSPLWQEAVEESEKKKLERFGIITDQLGEEEELPEETSEDQPKKEEKSQGQNSENELDENDEPVEENPEDHNLDFLVLDALFHFRKKLFVDTAEERAKERKKEKRKEKDYKSLSEFINCHKSFFEKFTNKCPEMMDVLCDKENLSRLMRNVFNKSVFGELCCIEKRDLHSENVAEGNVKENSEQPETIRKRKGIKRYCIWNYLERFQYLLLATIAKNPYAGAQRNHPRTVRDLEQKELYSFNQDKNVLEDKKCLEKEKTLRYRKTLGTYYRALQNFFTEKDFFEKLKMMYEEDVDNEEYYISFYLSYRLFDLDTAVDLTRRLSELHNTTLNVENTIFPALVPIFFVPNCFDKKVYLDTIIDVLNSDEYVLTPFDNPKDYEEKMGMQDWTTEELIDVHRFNLQSCKRYLSFLYSMYFPVLTALFYVLLYTTYDGNISLIIEVLKQYLNNGKCEKLFDQKINDWYLKSEFSNEERRRFTKIYLYNQHSLCNWIERVEWESILSLDYLKNYSIQTNIMDLVAKYKLSYIPKNASGESMIYDKNIDVSVPWRDNDERNRESDRKPDKLVD